MHTCLCLWAYTHTHTQRTHTTHTHTQRTHTHNAHTRITHTHTHNAHTHTHTHTHNYVLFKSFIIQDLAARNVLVSKEEVCKIADFGLSRETVDNAYDVKTVRK